MSQIKLCPHCLSTMPETAQVCPFCGRNMKNENPRGTLPYGTILAGRYTVGDFLSNDGEGVVYQAVDNHGPVRVTIKEYLPVTLAEERDETGALKPKAGNEVLYKTTRMDFVDLYKELMKITPSTGLETVLDVVETNNTAYAVLENPGGMPLSEYLALKKTHILPAEARSMLQPVFEGVAAMHQAGLIHRGICPDNIRVLENGKARLTGYATLGLRTLGSSLHAQLYEGYSAPEQYAKAEFEGRYTDAYALAAVFYRMVTGQAPVSAAQRRVADSNPSARSLDASLPAWLSEVLDQALQLSPERRIQTVTILMSSLNSPTAAQAIRRDSKQGKRTRYQLMGILGALLIGVCVLIIMGFWSMMKVGGQNPSSTPDSQPEPTATVPPTEYIPDFIGMTYAQIQASGQYAGKFRFYLQEEYSDTVPAKEIIRQDPMPNEEIVTDAQRTITLVISRGPENVIVPKIVGATQDAAITELQNRGLKARCVVQANDGSYAVGCVVKTDPAAGESVEPDSEVVIYIAAEAHLPVNNEEQVSMIEATPQPTPTPQPTATPAAD